MIYMKSNLDINYTQSLLEEYLGEEPTTGEKDADDGQKVEMRVKEEEIDEIGHDDAGITKGQDV